MSTVLQMSVMGVFQTYQRTHQVAFCLPRQFLFYFYKSSWLKHNVFKNLKQPVSLYSFNIHDRQAWANSADPDQTAPSGGFAIGTMCFACFSVMIKPHCSNFWRITTTFLDV